MLSAVAWHWFWCGHWCHVAAMSPSPAGRSQVCGGVFLAGPGRKTAGKWPFPGVSVPWQCHQGSRAAQGMFLLKGKLSPPRHSTPLDLICSRRSRFCVGEAVSCLKHKTTAHAGCSCSAGEFESHKTLGAAALSLKGVKNLVERKNPCFWRDVLHLSLPLTPIQKWVWLWFLVCWNIS